MAIKQKKKQLLGYLNINIMNAKNHRNYNNVPYGHTKLVELTQEANIAS